MKHRPSLFFRIPILSIFGFLLTLAPAAHGQLVFTFSDDGNGNTAVTLTGSGMIDNDSSTQSTFLGFNPTVPSAFDADMLDSPIPSAVSSTVGTGIDETLSDTLSINISGFGGITFDEFFSASGGFGFRDSGSSGYDPVTGASRTLSGVDTAGLIPLPYSTFSGVAGMTFTSSDGWTFRFAANTNANAAKKASLRKKIRKVKKKIRVAKRKSQKSKLKRFKRQLRRYNRQLRAL